MRKQLLFVVTAMMMGSVLFAQRTIIHCGQLVDARRNEILKEMSIIVDGNKVTEVQKGYTAAMGTDRTIDLKSKTVMPGLIDMHVHMETETNPNKYMETFTFNPADYAYQSVLFAERTLMAGFTSVRDLGGSGVNLSLRNAINKGLIKGPRVYTAGKSIATTGGHADPTNGYRRDLMGDPGPAQGVVNGVEDCIKAVRQRYKEGSDVIKITASGGVLSVAKSGENPQFTEAELKAIVETAKDYGFKVAAHCHGAEAMKRAIRAGVNSIEHGTYMDEEAMGLMKKMGTYFVPTITAGKSVADSAKKPGYFPEIVTPKALAIGPKIQSTFAQAYKSGVKIAFGTDAGVYAHGKNWMEFAYMVEAGMPALEAIHAATVSAADLLGDDRVGVIEKDKFADIIAVDGDPVKDISSMGRVRFVMKNGVVVKNL
ncbi:metal-dependent hydrolase family protein [Sediminibacterium soli]|uniref:metal-dependent hydrolase family protein n=1 Tax=Sediminibacterium soli TaxID=2698829 RepID=UPI00137AE933|nr:amidohydrolase family protein [Sediminibacterium soli]NCI47477.1 amidohydrolase family protein [Sediminibacterium soli]